MEDKDISPFRRGANNGLIVGVILALLFVVTAFQVYNPGNGALALGFNVLLIGLVVVVYILLHRSYVMDLFTTSIPNLWREGIVMFICGALVSTLVEYIYMEFVNPTFIYDIYELSISQWNELIASAPADAAAGYNEMVDELKKQLASGDIPGPMSTCFSISILEVIGGTILSLVVALLVKARRRKSRRKSRRKPRPVNAADTKADNKADKDDADANP